MFNLSFYMYIFICLLCFHKLICLFCIYTFIFMYLHLAYYYLYFFESRHQSHRFKRSGSPSAAKNVKAKASSAHSRQKRLGLFWPVPPTMGRQYLCPRQGRHLRCDGQCTCLQTTRLSIFSPAPVHPSPYPAVSPCPAPIGQPSQPRQPSQPSMHRWQRRGKGSGCRGAS